MPWLPLAYRGAFEGASLITDAAGKVLAERSPDDGEGIVLAEVELTRSTATMTVPTGRWLHPRGTVPALVWHYQRLHGRRWYAREHANSHEPASTGGE